MRKTYNSYKSYNSCRCAFRFPLSAFRFQLTLLRRLFFLAARHSEQAPSALAPQRQFSVFRFQFSVLRCASLWHTVCIFWRCNQKYNLL